MLIINKQLLLTITLSLNWNYRKKK